MPPPSAVLPCSACGGSGRLRGDARSTRVQQRSLGGHFPTQGEGVKTTASGESCCGTHPARTLSPQPTASSSRTRSTATTPARLRRRHCRPAEVRARCGGTFLQRLELSQKRQGNSLPGHTELVPICERVSPRSRQRRINGRCSGCSFLVGIAWPAKPSRDGPCILDCVAGATATAGGAVLDSAVETNGKSRTASFSLASVPLTD
jgi:hypothetical protein